MTLAQKLIDLANNLSAEKLSKVIKFAEYLKFKEESETKNLIDNLMDEYNEALKELAK